MMTDTQNQNLIERACRIARGDEAPDPAESGYQIRAAHKDYSARGSRRAHWYRMAWRNGDWRYLGDRRLANGTCYSADRHDTVYDTVFVGELIAQHDHGGPVTAIYLVVGGDPDKPLKSLDYRTRRDGQLAIVLPDGSELARPNPRRG